MEEFPLVDNSGNVTGRATRDECHSGTFLLHPVVHCVVLNTVGDWLLQLRSKSKKIQPAKWDTSVGGHVQAGEMITDALLREVEEEIGIKPDVVDFQELYQYPMRSEVEAEYVYSYLLIWEDGFVHQEEEIDKLEFWSRERIITKLGSGIFTPNFEDEFKRFYDFLNMDRG